MAMSTVVQAATDIYVVDDVVVTLSKSRPPILGVEANGRTNTSGWTDPVLSKHVYIVPPEDGIQGFDFVAVEPEGIVFQVLTPIAASYSDTCADWVKGVRIKSATNTIEALI